jgi:hypothetical protein
MPIPQPHNPTCIETFRILPPLLSRNLHYYRPPYLELILLHDSYRFCYTGVFTSSRPDLSPTPPVTTDGPENVVRSTIPTQLRKIIQDTDRNDSITTECGLCWLLIGSSFCHLLSHLQLFIGAFPLQVSSKSYHALLVQVHQPPRTPLGNHDVWTGLNAPQSGNLQSRSDLHSVFV